MALPALAGGGPLPANPIAAMRYYASLGLRVLPIVYRDKRPHPKIGDHWAPLQKAPPLASKFIDQVAGWGPVNVAIICDPHLVVFDVDNREFAAWFDAQGPERRYATWINSTPSGGLHIYCRSLEDQAGTIIKNASGIKVADVKARGGYVVAPPSEGANGDYEVAYGSPEQIRVEQNALQWFLEIVARWDGGQPVRLQPRPMNGDARPEYNDHRVQGSPPPSVQAQLEDEVRQAGVNRSLPPAVAKTLLEGAQAAGGYWKDPGDRSEVDFACVKELIGLGWPFPKIEQLFSFCVQGERYREPKSGHGYLLRTFENAQARYAQEQAALQLMVGPDWVLVLPIEWYADNGERHYSFGLRYKQEPVVQLDLTGEHFDDPRRFTRKCYNAAGPVNLGQFSTRDGLRTLFERVHATAVERPMPTVVTREGQLHQAICALVQGNLGEAVFVDGRIPLCWEEGGRVYLDPKRALPYLRSLHDRFEAREIWKAWLVCGGEALTYQGHPVWRAPKRALGLA